MREPLYLLALLSEISQVSSMQAKHNASFYSDKTCIPCGLRCKVSELYNMNKENQQKLLRDTEKAFLLGRKGIISFGIDD